MKSNAVLQEDMFFEEEWFPEELLIMEPKEDISTAGWAEENVYVIKSAKPGPWRNINNPPLVGIMNIADRKGVFKNIRNLVCCKGVQTGVTVAGHIIIFKRMDGSAQTALLVMETEKKVRRMSNQRIQPALRRCKKLADQLSDNPDDMKNDSIVMRTGFCLNMGYSGSEAAVSSDTCETVVLDETDKYEKEMNIEQAKDRTTTYIRTGLNFIFSTPGLEGGPIMGELDNCDTVMEYHVECPDCGELQVMTYDNFWWPDKEEATKRNSVELRRHANTILRESSARYICSGCGVLWDDYDRDKAVRLGLNHYFHGWKMKENIDLPVSIGIHFPSWISPFKSLSAIVSRRLKAEAADHPVKLRAWYNQEAAEPYIERQSDRKEDNILALRDDRPRGLVPKDISCIICSIDTQQHGFYYEVRALGWGHDLESWQIREGYVETTKALEDVLYKSEYHDVDGNKYIINAAFMDSGGGTGTIPNHSRTAEVYDFCRFNPLVRPLKGRRTMAAPYETKHLDRYPKSKKPIPGGLTLYHLNVTYFKDALARKVAIHPEDIGAWHLHSECPMEYAQHMVVERRDEKGFWHNGNPKTGRGKKPNHYWDIGVYFLAAAEILQVKFWSRPEEETTTETTNKTKQPKKNRGRW